MDKFAVASLSPTVDLQFLGGYLFRVLQEIVEEQGIERSGFYNYYAQHLKQRIGLQAYEEDLAHFLLARGPERPLLHAGIGLGTLACALAANGLTVTGIEVDDGRVGSARLLRDAVVQMWPDVAGRYRIVHGAFPDVATPPMWAPWKQPEIALDPRATLLFTNVVMSWSDELQRSILATLPRFAEVILDLRTFGIVRDDESARQALFARIAERAVVAERLPDVTRHLHLARFAFAKEI